MPAYVLANITVTDPENYQDYIKMSPESISQYGGKFIVRGPEPEILEGTWMPKRLVLLEFPSMAQARLWWDSPEYAPAKAKRQATATADFVIMPGV
jgi:uncharacterized protein (DUF1330 family)